MLAGGNNILFTQDFDGVLLTPRAASIDVVAEAPDAVAVRAEAGVEWDDLVAWAVERDLWGIENLSLIPGKVGAAPVQNIGAYGAEAKDAIESVEMFCTDTCNTLILSREHCAFGYRESVFKHALRGRVVITAVTFRLSRRPRPDLGYGDLLRETEARGGATLRNIREAVCAIRRSEAARHGRTGQCRQFLQESGGGGRRRRTASDGLPRPAVYPAAEGRMKLAAGWLIEQAGMKGAPRRLRGRPRPAGAGARQLRGRHGRRGAGAGS